MAEIEVERRAAARDIVEAVDAVLDADKGWSGGPDDSGPLCRALAELRRRWTWTRVRDLRAAVTTADPVTADRPPARDGLGDLSRPCGADDCAETVADCFAHTAQRMTARAQPGTPGSERGAVERCPGCDGGEPIQGRCPWCERRDDTKRGLRGELAALIAEAEGPHGNYSVRTYELRAILDGPR